MADKQTENKQTQPQSIGGLGLAPVFQRPAKAYTTKDGKSTMVARILVPFGILMLEATCWCKRLENKQAGETSLEYTIGLPRGLSANDDIPGAGEKLDAWKDHVLAEGGPLDSWMATLTVGGKALIPSAPRLVKTIKAPADGAVAGVVVTPPQTVPSK